MRVTVLVLVSISCGCVKPPPRGFGRVVQFSPGAAEIGESDVAKGLHVTFDRPVAPEKMQPLAAAFRIVPEVPGEARWIDRQTLAFFPSRMLQPSTAYSVTLDRHLLTAPDTAVASWSGARFVFRRIEIEAVTLAGPKQFQRRTPLVTVRASQRVRPADAAAGCAFYQGGRGAETRARSEETHSFDADQVLHLVPAEPLRPGTDYTFRCDAAFKPAGGGEGLAPAHETTFSTIGPAEVKRLGPGGRDVGADDVKVELAFATPMDPEEVRKHVALTPVGGQAIPIQLAGDATGTTFGWTGDLEPGSTYRLVVTAPLADVFGQTVSPKEHEFTVGDASPRLRIQRGIFVAERASGRYPVWTRNLSSFQLRCAPVPEAKLTAVLTGPFNYDSWWDASRGAPDWKTLGLSVHEREVKSVPAHNRWVDQSVALRPACGGGASGVYLLEVESKEDPRGKRQALVDVTDLGLLAKVGNASSLIWVVRLSTGEPVAGAQVKVRDLQGRVGFSGKSNADGVVLAPGASRLVGVKPRERPEGEEGEWSEYDDYRARRVIVTAQSGDDLAVLDTSWNNGIQVWNFQVPPDRQGGLYRVRGFIHSDRGLYRPGDTVHLRGLVRRIDAAGRMAVPRKRKIAVTIEDPRGATLVTEELTVSAFGGFWRDLALPAETAALGDYTVRAELEGQRFSERFSVEEYRPRTFEVKVQTPKKNVFFGQKLRFSLAASYLYGSPMREAKLTWNLRRRGHLPIFPGFEGYSFQDLATLWDSGRWWADREERSFSDAVADGEGTLDAAGKAAIVATDAAKDLPGPYDYLFQATVEDKTGQAVTATEVVSGHRANLYLGLHASEWVQAVDMPFGVQVVAFDAEGKRRTASAHVTLTRRSYDCHTLAYGRCQRGQASTPSVDRNLAVADAGSAAVERVTLREPGEYLVSVTGTDEKGHKALATEVIYVIGQGEAFWSGDEGDRMTVIASKPRYQPGETARLVPQVQMPGARALVTLERDGVLSYQVKTIATSGQAIEVAIEPRLAPNAFASVVMVRGRTGAGDAHRPRFRMGVVDLVVDSGAKKLAVAVETERLSYQPGELVKAKVRVTGSDGAPVKGELALAVADEGVLQIVGFKTPDPMPVFYAPWGLGVESSTTWNRLLLKHNPEDLDGEEGGDGGGDEAGRIRSRFMATAFWKPALVTDGDGVVEVQFTAPDNLTAFRVMAVVADGADRFGAGEQRFTVSKPLQAVAALPRFLTVGDKLQARVVVHNNTELPLPVSVNASATGLTLGTSHQTITVAAGGQKVVSFPAVAATAGEAHVVFKVAGGEHRDAVLTKLPVSSAGIPEVLLVGEGVASGRVEHRLPETGLVLPGRGALEVSLDPTGLGRLEEGLKYLVEYPYGCLEQTTSTMVPMIALGDLARTLDLKEVGAAKAHGYVEAGVAKILRHQHEDGGFGLWLGTPPAVHYTATALWGLQLARAEGYTVDGAAMDRGAAYLRARLGESRGHEGELVGEGGSEAFAAYVLSTLGQAEAGPLGRLYQERQQLPVYGRAFLARALIKTRPELAVAMADELAALVKGPVLLHEGGPDLNYYWSSDARTTALVLSALLELKPQHPAVGQLADGLLAARVEGRWGTTQENLFSVLALAQLARVRTEREVTATVSMGGKVLGRPALKAKAAHLRVPLGEAKGPLVIESDGQLFYAARLHVERPLNAPKPADRGLSVERVYLDPETGATLTGLKVGQVAKVVITVRSEERLAHVAVVDRLPAGVEPVLTRFSPSVPATERQSLWWGYTGTAWQREELRDDRAQMFADVLAAGDSRREYLVRAVAAGTFATAPATVEAMYRPQLRGRSEAATLTVLP